MTRIGCFGARSDSRGLARQTESFCKWLEPDRVWGLDLTVDNLSPYPCDWSGYDQSILTVSAHSDIQETAVRSWLRGLDVVFGAETFYRQEFYEWAKAERVRTILQINPEFASWFQPKWSHEPRPDVMVAPTTWLLNKMPGVWHLPFPVDRHEFPFRLRTRARRFVHVAGHRAAGDRAGTRILIPSAGRVRDAEIIIRTQSDLGLTGPFLRHVRVEHTNLANPFLLYEDADVVVIPRRYGGQCLAMNEALSSGAPVICLDRSPENSWGGVATVPSRVRGSMRTKGGQFRSYDASDRNMGLAKVMKDLMENPDQVEELSRAADKYAESLSWNALLPVYRDVLRCVAEGNDLSYIL